jgi:tripartite-type tricarboxylate transporter receptor subunit TctC
VVDSRGSSGRDDHHPPGTLHTARLIGLSNNSHVPASERDSYHHAMQRNVIAPISITLTPILDGRLFPLGVTTARHSILLPQVPTIAEAGVAGFDFPIWYGIWAPEGSPTGVVNKLSMDIARVLAGPDLRDWIAKHGGEPMNMTQPEFARFVQSDSEDAARFIEADVP